jgi:MoaA/NifB/PqqE/SkfB family radical SAM enzyme
MEKKGLLVSRDWDDYDGNFKSVMRLENLSRQDLEDARRKACAAWEEAQTNGLTLNDYWQKFSAACQRRGLLYSLKKAAGFLKKGRIKELLHKVKSNNLDILGVFNGRLAFKGPSTLQIDLTDYCNNNCLACWCNSPLLSPERRNKPKDMLPALLVKKLISDAHGIGLREIYFSGGGEPFMHPDILQILEHAKGLGIACGVNTNFTLLNEQTVDKLVALGLDHLTVSIWAGSAEIYKALHPNKSEEDFYRIREMLTRLNSLKERAPDIKIYNVICNLNYRQIREMLEFARSTKCEFVEFTVVDTMPGATDKLILSPEEGRCVLEQFKELRGEYIDPSNGLRPKILNLETFLRRVANLDAQTAQYDSNFIDNMPCYIGWLFARIMPNGDVNSCLKSHRFPVGNIHRQSFQEIWNSSAQIYFRQKTLKLRKDDSFFSLIGNDPDCQTGCYKSCDDIGRNMLMHQRINQLLPHQRRILKFLGKSRLFK